MFYITKNENILSVFPSDHGITYPCSYDLQSMQILSEFDNFYTQMFKKSVQSNDSCNVKIDFIDKRHELLLFYNVLDCVFGHSLCKMFHLAKIQKIFKNADIYVISNINTQHFIPPGFGKIIVNCDFYDIYKIHDLYPLCNDIKEKYRYSNIDYIISDTYSSLTENERLYFINSWGIKEINTKKRIIFYERRDRKWGKYLQKFRYKFYRGCDFSSSIR